MNIVFNTPYIAWMRQIKDSMSREEFNNITPEMIEKKQNREAGAYDLIMEIVELCQKIQAPILSIDEIYQQTIK